MCVRVCVNMSAGACGGQKRASGFIGGCEPPYVVGKEPESSAGAELPLSC